MQFIMNKRIIKKIKWFIIIVIVIAVGVFCIKKGLEMLKQKENDDLKTDLLLVQAKIKMIKGKSDVKANKDDFIGTKISDSNNDELKEFLKNLNISESDLENYFILSKQDFESMGIANELKNIEENVYIVNYDTAEVIYKKGVEINNKLKYKLSDIVTKEQQKYWILYNRIDVKK